MTLEQSLVSAIRHRIVPGIVSQQQYQRRGDDAPDSPLYVREILYEVSASSLCQSTQSRRYLVELDVFGDGRRLNGCTPVNLTAESIRDQFDNLDSSGAISLPGWTGVSAYVDTPPVMEALETDEKILYRRPVLFYATMLISMGAAYAADGQS